MRRVVPVEDYLGALRSELRGIDLTTASPLDTVYMGGGTPSLIGPQGIAALLALVRNSFDVAATAEITIEANPDDVSIEAAREWAAAGVNRVSLGIQTFDDTVLEWMHRAHSGDQARQAVQYLRAAGFENISVDLIFALPDHLLRSWESDLRQALELEPDHISLYGLTIERSTPLFRWQERGLVQPAAEELYADEFLLAHQMASDAGFNHYEVSNFARPGRESRHNSAYWSGVPYIGIGPSAHSFDGTTRRWNASAYADWVSRLQLGQAPIDGEEKLTDSNRLAEKVYLGLRTTNGLRAGAADMVKAGMWRSQGWAWIENDTVRLTPEGWLRLDSLASGLTGF